MADEAQRLIIGDSAIAAATDPRRRRFFLRKRAQVTPANCENCGTPLTGPYCSKCGQHAIDYRRSFGRVFLDVLDSFLNWDSKFFHTVGLLLVRPWRLTNAFIAGQRVRYVHPLRLYLLVSVGFFFGVHELAKQTKFDTRASELTPARRAKLEAKLARLPPDAQADVRDELEHPENHRTRMHFGTAGKEQPFDKWMNERVKAKVGENGINAKFFFLAVVDNLPAMMLCCIPLFAFVLKLLYIRRGVFYIDHLIYALHIHAFIYIAILILGSVIAFAEDYLGTLGGLLNAALIFATIALLLLSIRRVYRQGWFMSVLKFAFGGIVYFFVLMCALAATFFITLALPD